MAFEYQAEARWKQNVAVLGPFAPIDENFAGIEVDIADLDVDELVHAYSGIEEQFEQDLVLHIAAILDGSEEPFQIGRHLAKILWDFTYLCWANPIPELIAAAGPEVTETYIDFFTATIRNRNTRQAYARACWQFFDWCAAHGLELTTVRPFHVAAWIEDFPGSKPTIKQKLAAVRMLYDFLVVRQITPSNPAHSVRGPKYVVKKGKTPVWSREDAKTLLDSIPKDSVSGLRDRALIAAMLYSFARVSAVLKVKFDDYYHNGARRRLRLHEKGGKDRASPARGNIGRVHCGRRSPEWPTPVPER
jgi:hypothetical protein